MSVGDKTRQRRRKTLITTIPTICGSVAGKPSGLGVALHNAGYKAAQIPFTYMAMGTDDIDEALGVAKTIGFRGLAVSMPHKASVIARLDTVGDDVQRIGACNTVVFDGATTSGHNTDWIGARDAIRETNAPMPSRALIVGAGGAARAIAYALSELGAEVQIAARNEDAARQVALDLGLGGSSSIESSIGSNADLVVNATPDASTSGPVQLDNYKSVRMVFDVVFNELETPLIAEANRRGLVTVPGWRMLLHQALEQFRLYTGQEPPADEMSTVLRDAFAPRD